MFFLSRYIWAETSTSARLKSWVPVPITKPCGKPHAVFRSEFLPNMGCGISREWEVIFSGFTAFYTYSV